MRLINIIILLALSIFIFLTACSTKNISPPQAPESQSSKPVAAPVPKESQQAEWERTVSEARKEGIIVLYGATGVAQARDRFIRAIKEKFGISLEVTIAGGAQLTGKLVNERRAGLYTVDVYMGGAATILNDLVPRNVLEPIEPYLILPEVKDPSAWFGGSLPFWEKQRVSLATLASIPSGHQAINTSLLRPDELTSYRDLIKPKLKGLIAMSDPTTAGAGNAWFNLAIRLMGEDYLKELVKQDLMITRDFQLLSEWLARGKYAVAMGINPGGIRILIRDGAPIAILPPFKEGVNIGPAGGIVAPVNKGPHPNATKVFINWVLSKEGQTVFSRAAGLASRRLDVPGDHLEPWAVPDPKIKYLIQDEEYTRKEIEMQDLAKKIFAQALR